MGNNGRVRGFEVVSSYERKGIHLPVRKTAHSAGYDIAAAEDVIIPPRQSAVVPTGIKAFMQEGEYLGIHVRSGLSIKNNISLLNDEGVIDKDYIESDNEGHILIALFNHSDSPFKVEKGSRVAQGIFKRFYKTDDDNATEQRNGGIGSTGK